MSLALLKQQPSCKMLLYFYEFLMEILTWKILKLDIICILLCLTLLSSLIVIQRFYSTFLCMLQAFLSYVHEVETLDGQPCTGKKGEDESSLSKKEVETVMKELGINYCPDGSKLSGKMCADDFAAVFEVEEPSLEEVKEAFEVFDVNRDGYIDEMELKRVLCVLGFKMKCNMECRRMIQVFDNDCDGRIDFNEFVILVENSFCK